jgi:release factor glutamine methyltransferase
LRSAVTTLAAAGIETASVDAEWLLAGTLGVRRSELHVVLDRELPEDLAQRYDEAIRRRAARQPLQRILGWEDFRGLRIRLTLDVLIPRPETEMLVEWALSLLPAAVIDDSTRRPALGGSPPQPFLDGCARRPVVLDVGAGSGCIACAIAWERPDVDVTAIDLMPAAAAVARDNAAGLGVSERVRVVVGDLATACRPGSADLIVSNPPYLTPAMLAAAEPEVREHEPEKALAGGSDGLGVLRPLVADAHRVLRPGGALIVETAGRDRADLVASLFGDAGFVDVTVQPDLAGVRRFVAGRRPRVPSAGFAGAIDPSGGGYRAGGDRGGRSPLRTTGAALAPPDVE